MQTRHSPGRRRSCDGSIRSLPLWEIAIALLFSGSTLFGQPEQATIDFEGDSLLSGTIVDEISAIGSSGSIGPIGVVGTLPGSTTNHAVILSSDTPGSASDLGTPNEDFGGPGVGAGGALGGSAPNDTSLGNLLIVATDLVDFDGDGLVDAPVDGSASDMKFILDFQSITTPYAPETVTILGLTLVDADGADPGLARVLDEYGNVLSETPLTPTGDNGVVTQWLGTPGYGVSGAAQLELILHGSAAIDEVLLELTLPSPPECYLPHNGELEVDESLPLSFGMPITGGAGDRTVTSSGLPAGVLTDPPLPAVFPPGEALLIVSWPAGEPPIGTHSLPFTVTDDLGRSSSCTAQVEVDCDLHFEPYGQPDDHTLCEGEDHTFHAVVHGTEYAILQWSLNGTPIPGAHALDFTVYGATSSDEGVYTLSITNSCGTLTSHSAYLDVRKKPEVDQQPGDQQVCKGDELVLTVEASGDEPIYYQWKHNGYEIYGETSATLVIDEVMHHHAGVYKLWIWNDCGEIVIDPIHVEVRNKPEIDVHPEDKILCESETLTLSVEASGSDPLSYEWSRDGEVLAGQTDATLTIHSATMMDSGNYVVRVSNDCGEVYSDPAHVVVKKAPEIIEGPADQQVCEGETITLSVVATGTEPLDYQWKKDGVEISGATSPTLTFENAQLSDAGTYTVRVENDCGYDEAHAEVEVREAPEIEVEPVGQVLCEGDPLTLTVTAAGSAPLHYQWRKDGVAIPGAEESTYTVAAVTTADAGIYTVRISNDCGEVTSDPAEVVVRVAPVITVPPVGQILCEGETIELSVTASGSEPLSYQWFVDGVAIPDAILGTLTIPNALATDSGAYSVLVTNDCGPAMSDPVAVLVRVSPTIDVDPADQVLCEGETISLSVLASGSAVLTYQWSVDGIPIPGATEATLSIPNALASNSGIYTVVVTNDCGSATSAGADVLVRVAPTVVTPPKSQLVCVGETLSLSVMAAGSEPLSYQWRLNGVDLPGETQSNLTIANIQTSQAGLYDVLVSNACGMVASEAADIQVGVPRTITSKPQSRGVCEGDPVTFTAGAEGTAPLTYQWRFNGVPIPGATDSSYTILAVTLADAGSYDVVVSNACGTDTSNAAILTVLVAPAITGNPKGAEECVGTPVTLSVSATGSDPLAYQWFLDSMPIPGATQSTLDLTPLAVSDAGSYTVTVTNTCGQVTSTPAIVSVLTPPTITASPTDETICVGDPVTFSVTATGSPPLSYQWLLDGAPISGATMANLTIGSVQLADAGSYTVTVTNICGSETSSAAVLTVAEESTITVDSPAAIDICLGDTVTLMTTVVGFPPITLSWSLNGVAIPGSGAANFTISNATLTDAGTYQLTATNLCGTVLSTTIAVTVQTPPTITVQPVGDDEICPNEGNSFTFSVTATGDPTRTFQWFFNGAVIPGATNSTLTITDVVRADYGDYTVEVSNVCATITSDVATLAEPELGFCEAEFDRGDCNADGLKDIADGIYIFRFSFQGFGTPACFDACDHNDDGTVDISDAMFFTTYLFMGTAPPPAPTNECGLDPTPDELECPLFLPCVSP